MMSNSFGPWTTAIDSGSSAQLSRFWKQRMKMLPIVRRSSPVVSHKGQFLLAVAAILAFALPTLQISRSVAAVEAEPENRAAAGKPFRVTLPGDLVVEVIGVGHNPSKGKPWWGPDGTLIPAPYDRCNSTTSGGNNEVSREIALRWISKPEDATVHWYPNVSSSSGASLAFDANGKALPGVEIVSGMFLKTQKTCNLNFQIAAGDWKTVTENSGREWVTYTDLAHGYAVSPAIEVDGATRLTISHDVVDRDVRIVAVDQQGHEITTQNHGGGRVKGFSQLTVIFPKLPLKEIKAFRLQARDWRKAEITGVALNSGETTQPVLKAESPQGATKPQSEGP